MIRYIAFLLLLCGLKQGMATPPENTCRNMESLLGFVEGHIRNGLEAEDLQMARYHTFKALNTLVKTSDRYGSCSCDFALERIRQCEAGLKLATRVNTLDGTQILLKRALKDIRATESALEAHDKTHTGAYDHELLAVNTLSAAPDSGRNPMEMLELEAKIDKSLDAYRKSLDEVVQTVPCKEATQFVKRVYAHCEKQLLREDLSAAKRYYNIRTSEITAEALEELGGCPQQ